MVTPLVVKLHLRDLADTGKVVGRIYAFSAAGSIFGTFITGFALIQWVGTTHTLILVAVTLVAPALVFGNLMRNKSLSLASLLILLGLGATGFATGALDSGCTRESNYYCIRVSDEIVEGDRPVKVLHLDKLLHSYASVEDPTYLNYGYEKMEEIYPESVLDVIEIDPEVTAVAYDYLGLASDSRIVTYNEDARMVLPDLQDGRYDLIIGDAFHDISVPYHLTTREFNEPVLDLLTEQGIYATNVIDQLHSGKFLRAFANTLHQTFDHVYIFRDVPNWESDRRHTFVVVGSLQPVDSTDVYSAANQAGISDPVSNGMPQAKFDSWLASQSNVLLIDDYAPVDYLLASVFFARDETSSAEQHFQRGLALQGEGRSVDSIFECDEAISLDAGFVLAYHNRGENYARLGQFRRAIKHYTQAIDLEPRTALLYFSRGAAYADQGELEQATENFNEGIRLNPESVLAYRQRGLAYFDLGQTQRSIQDLNDAISLDPDHALTYFQRATAHQTLGQFQSAIEDFDEAIRLDPNEAAFHLDRGTAYFFLEQFQQALQGYNESIRLNPGVVLAYVNLAQINTILGKDTEAQQDMNRAIELGSDRGELEGIIEGIKSQR